MLKNISKVEIKSSYFSTLATFDFFNPIDSNKEKITKGALIYGKNGSGKSTIAKAFRKIKGENITEIESSLCYDVNNNLESLNSDDKNKIFIFDEEYIDKNVKLKEDNLDTIVMLGPVADLSDKIDIAKDEFYSLKDMFDQKSNICDEYNDSSNIKSPDYFLSKIENALRGDDNWSGRDKKIKNGRVNTPVRRDETYKLFIDIIPEKTRTELVVDFNNGINELKNLRDTDNTITYAVPKIPGDYFNIDSNKIEKLLKQKLERPELSEREKKLFKLIETNQIDNLESRLSVLQSPNTNECPYCFQELSPDYKQDLVMSIEKVLNKIVEEHREHLKASIINPIELNLVFYNELESYDDCIELMDSINKVLTSINQMIQSKIDNPYVPVNESIKSISQMVDKLKQLLKTLENERIEHNNIDKRKGELTSKLHKINAEIAHYDIVDLLDQYNTQLEEQTVAINERKSLEKELKKKEQTLIDLDAKRNNIQLAIDSINNCMKYIFFEEDRMSLEYDGTAYKLLSRGKSVKPNNISVGERNILALSYFFTQILEGQEKDTAYDKDYLLVIDDPISSYDMENKIGILSFIKYKFSLFLEGNKNTKVLVLTHDLTTFYDLHKIFEEIIVECKQNQWGQLKFNEFELRNKELISFSYKKRHEYTEMLKIIYSYAKEENIENSIVIGNIMRQTLEAFATFEYKKGIVDISTNEQILALLKEPEYISYYKNLMYRLVLHGGSHKEEQIKAMNDTNFFALISDKEKIRTAKDVICFIYLLNKRHILEHLKEDGTDIENSLDTWCKDIKSRAAVI